MTATRTFSVLGSALAICLASPAAAQVVLDPAPITLKVAVQVSNMMPDADRLVINCYLLKVSNPTTSVAPNTNVLENSAPTGANTAILRGGGGIVQVVNGGFNGTVNVPFAELISGHAVAEILDANYYMCTMDILQRQSQTDPHPLIPRPPDSEVWNLHKPGTPLVYRISGPFPPQP